jgi:hypothetical protein
MLQGPLKVDSVFKGIATRERYAASNDQFSRAAVSSGKTGGAIALLTKSGF